ncbi:PspC domain-containing protein [Streptomyces sp. NBC_01216]|uniref:PspC domain-containing protein n=1 Tax=unclassified Streptomyces TaxID=2593676 RepID=UPI002E129A24|nr:PspC domain-containing protein [Streptomyces sp. NBC_01216]
MTSSTPSSHEVTQPAEAPSLASLRRSQRHKVVAGVCGGLGRHFDLDPVIFRIVIGVLSVTGGIGLIFYGFAWLWIPLAGDEENEGRRLLSGRVDGASLAAVLMALAGCGVFLSMLRNGGTLAFGVMLSIAVCGAAAWSRQRRQTGGDVEGRRDAAATAAASEAPPETKAPPLVEFPSWWKDPIVKDGSTGRIAIGYLWGPHGVTENGEFPGGEVPVPGSQWGRRSEDPWQGPAMAPARPRTRSIGGLVFLLALLAGGLGTGLSWETHPLGTSLQIGLVAALAVFGLGLVLSSVVGRTGFGTIFLTMVTAALLAAAVALPESISTDWARTTWRPTAVTAVQPRYELGTGAGTLDLSGLAVPTGTTVTTEAEVGAGKLEVIVPKNVTVTLRAKVGLGDLRLPQQPPGDIDIAPDRDVTRTLAPPTGTDPAGTLDLSLEVGLGQVEVTRAAS